MSVPPVRPSCHATIAPPAPSAATTGNLWSPDVAHTTTPPLAHGTAPPSGTFSARRPSPAPRLASHVTKAPPAPSRTIVGATSSPAVVVTADPSCRAIEIVLVSGETEYGAVRTARTRTEGADQSGRQALTSESVTPAIQVE